MTSFSFYDPGSDLTGVIETARRLSVPCVELDESFLNADPQQLLCARYEDGLRYACLRLQGTPSSYTTDDLTRIGRWCEANYIEAVVFMSPGDSAECAGDVLNTLDCFRLKIVFANVNGSFLSKPDDIAAFFRAHSNAYLHYDPAQMVSQRTHPFLSALNGQTYRRRLFMVRAEDRRFNGESALPAQGDAELAEICSSAAAFGLDMYVSLQPCGGFGLDEIKTAMCAVMCKI